MNKVLLFLLIYLSLPYPFVQAVNYTASTKEISEKLRPYGLDKKEAGIYQMKGLIDNKTMEIKIIDGIVSSIGINFIPSGLKETENALLCDFIERYWLELLLCRDNLEVAKKLKEDKVDLFFDSDYYNVSLLSIKQLLNAINPEIISYRKADSTYHFEWKTFDEKDVVLSFQKRIGLILGMDKRELEAYFMFQLNNYSSSANSIPLSPDHAKTSIMPDIFTEKGDTYLIPEMVSDRYWKKENGSFSLLYDSNHISESIINLFTGGYAISQEIDLLIEQRYYTSEHHKFNYPLTKFLSFMHTENNITYVGIDEIRKDTITGVVIFENKDFMYNHAIYFSSPVSAIEDRKGVIDASIYCYIPTHNIETIYGIYEEGNKKKKIKVIPQ